MFTAGKLALVFTLVTVAAAAGVLLFTTGDGAAVGSLLKEQIGFVEFDNTAQRHAHLASLFCICCLGLVGTFLYHTNRLHRRLPGIDALYSFISRPSAIPILMLTAACFLENSTVGRDKWILFFAIGWIFFLLPAFSPRIRKVQWVTPLLYGITGLFVIVPYLGMWWAPVDMTFFRVPWEVHLGCILGAANQIGGGMSPGVDMLTGYGILFPLLLGLYQRTFGFLDIAGQQYLLLAVQGVFLVLLLWSWRMWNRRHPLYLLIPLLMLTPFIFNYRNLTYLNNTGIRFFNFAMIPFMLLALRHVSRWEFFMGMGIGMAFAINPETGIAVGMGTCAAVITSRPCTRFGEMAKALGFWLLGAAVALGAVQGVIIATGDAGAHYYPFENINRFMGGFGGLPFYFDSLALLIFLHAAYVAIRTATLWGANPLSFRQRFRLMVSVALLIWFAYYAIRASDPHLLTQFALYSFLLIEMLDIRRFRLFWTRPSGSLRRLFLPLPILALLVVVVPMIGRITTDPLTSIADAYDVDDSVVVGGAHFSRAYGTLLQDKIDYLKKHREDAPLLLTGTSHTVPFMAHYFPRGSFLDIYGLSTSEEGYAENLKKIRDQKLAYLYFDNPLTYDVLGSPLGQREFFARLKKDLGGDYSLVTTASGWEIWRRNQ